MPETDVFLVCVKPSPVTYDSVNTYAGENLCWSVHEKNTPYARKTLKAEYSIPAIRTANAYYPTVLVPDASSCHTFCEGKNPNWFGKMNDEIYP